MRKEKTIKVAGLFEEKKEKWRAENVEKETLNKIQLENEGFLNEKKMKKTGNFQFFRSEKLIRFHRGRQSILAGIERTQAFSSEIQARASRNSHVYGFPQ